MAYVRRRIEAALRKAARGFPALIVTGPRRCGKTEVLRHAFPDASAFLLEDPEVLRRVRSDPRQFLDGVKTPVILDEIQNAPELFAHVRSRIDLGRRRHGPWLFTGSREAGLMQGVTESMAGRAAVFSMLPFGVEESARVGWVRGGFPEVVPRPSHADAWFSSYVQTYLERDVRQVTAVKDLARFRHFLALLASRAGQTLNRSDIAAPLGVSVPTISSWLGVLETTGQILLLPPFFENAGKRLMKSPKLHFVDAGLLTHLLGIRSEQALLASPFAGPVFEGFVASEIVKAQVHRGRRREIYGFRDAHGLEVDLVVPLGGRRLALVEAKATRSPDPRSLGPLFRVRDARRGWDVHAFLVYRWRPQDPPTTALAPGVEAVGVQALITRLFDD
ncbi:MAG: ATP-binding protein [Planctomycetes bacterium]|nr:ATP-binding protein [Planctomycetota bacterium]